MKPRHAHGTELESYFVFTTPPETFTLDLQGARVETYRNDDGRVRAARATGDLPAASTFEMLRGMLEGGELRWLEIGLRAYSLMEGKREYRPWRRNAHLSLEALLALETLEPEVRYHAPV